MNPCERSSCLTLIMVAFATAVLIQQSPAQIAAPTEGKLAQRLGYPPDARLLLIQSDIGMMHAIDRATFEAIEKKWITSATVLVAGPWFPEAAAFARAHAEGDYGVHLMLNSEWTPYRWGPLLPAAQVPSLLDADGYFPATEDEVIRNARPEELERELRAQIDKAKAAGINITHLDSHMDTLFATPQLFAIYRKLGEDYHVPVLVTREVVTRLKLTDTDGVVVLDRRIEMRPGVPRAQWLDAYKKMLSPLPPGTYLLSVHLGYNDPEHQAATFGHQNWGAAWRQADLDTISSPEFHQFLKEQDYILITWKELAKANTKSIERGGRPRTGGAPPLSRSDRVGDGSRRRGSSFGSRPGGNKWLRTLEHHRRESVDREPEDDAGNNGRNHDQGLRTHQISTERKQRADDQSEDDPMPGPVKPQS
jgi:chitin disaccharide deacetylase